MHAFTTKLEIEVKPSCETGIELNVNGYLEQEKTREMT